MSTNTENAMLIMRVMRLAQAAVKSRFVQQVVPKRLTIVQFNALQHLHWYSSESGMTISELGEHLGLAHSTVSGLVDRLARDGWIMRHKSDKDRRRSQVQLTEQSKVLFQERVESAASFWKQAVGQLTPEEQAGVIKSLKRLAQVMEGPTWPSYDQLHPRDLNHLESRLEAELEEFAQTKLRLIGRRFILAQMAEQRNQHELAAYLKQVASEEIRHTNQIFTLFEHKQPLKALLSNLISQDRIVSEELLELVDTAYAVNHHKSLSLLQQMVQDSQRYKRWFRDTLEQMGD